MEKMPKIYMAYGSNLNVKQMHIRCPFAKVYKTAELPGYRLLFRGGNGGAVATIEPREGSSVSVALWKITPFDEKALDRYEGWPRLYRKEIFKITLGKRKVRVFAYIMNDGFPLGRPSRSYFTTILEGYEEFMFDQALLEKAVLVSIEHTH